MSDEIARLSPRPIDHGELYDAILAEDCPDCEAAVGEHCIRATAGIRYETRLAHEGRITAAAAKRAADHA
jgi:hypothetical protein